MSVQYIMCKFVLEIYLSFLSVDSIRLHYFTLQMKITIHSFITVSIPSVQVQAVRQSALVDSSKLLLLPAGKMNDAGINQLMKSLMAR